MMYRPSSTCILLIKWHMQVGLLRSAMNLKMQGFNPNCISLCEFILHVSQNIKFKIYGTTILPFVFYECET
jgi:hypothetical protein